ncbi:TetR/AcrR family transcriptional regulator [Clostridium hydrogenum]|uniref:TetR/AcrR family transcriptional regulator n=1 Tax=Clostridium hydrogenum TaxID=2855764 RepID=UPI001F30F8EB|nr:TetR/AcrR family transcriptional regulator [Clostridium hydrogenum]
MEKFLSLPVEKQNTIIDAALKCFGTNGYKKTSVSEIASNAGISKAMVFHYFGTKKALYIYLIELSSDLIMNEIYEKFDKTITDFFDRIIISGNIKVSVMKKHPAIFLFLTNVYFETDEEVKKDIQNIFVKGEVFRNKIAFDGTDTSKFKTGIDSKLVMKMLVWLAEGYTSELSNKINTEADFDELFKEYYECVNLIKNNFYKEEYIK